MIRPLTNEERQYIVTHATKFDNGAAWGVELADGQILK